MGLYYSSSTAGQVWVPGSIPNVTVQTAVSGTATTGVLVLVGEALGGAPSALDTDLTLSDVQYGPTDLAAVQSRFISGPLVDAYANAVSASNDPAISASFGEIYLLKTNQSTKATSVLTLPGINSSYSIIADQNWGVLGNNIYAQILSYATEVAPTTGIFTYLPNFSTASTLGWRVDGGGVTTQNIVAAQAPDTLFTNLNSFFSLSSANAGTVSVGLLATGGVSSFASITAGLSTYIQTSLSTVGSTVTISLASGVWAVTPTVANGLIGGTLIIPAVSGLGGTGSVNEGSYIVTSATSNSITGTRIAANNPSVSFAAVVASTGTALSTGPFEIYTAGAIQEVGGINRGVLAGLLSPTITGVASGFTLTITLNQNWATRPQVNDWLWLSLGGTDDGWYTVTASTATTVSCALVGLLTVDNILTGGLANIAAGTVVSPSTLVVFRPPVLGVGKSMELQDGGGAANITTNFFTTAGAQVAWISTTAARVVETSATENAVSWVANRKITNSQDNITNIGGDVLLNVAYQGTTGTLSVVATNGVPTSITTTVSGGIGTNLNIPLAIFQSLGDVAAYINAQPGYQAAVQQSLYGGYPSIALDIVSGVGICSSNNNSGSVAVQGPGRLKGDAWAFYNAISNSSVLVLETNAANATALTYTPVRAVAGLPDPSNVFYLSGGATGGTSNASVQACLVQAENIACNSVVPLFSQNASLDAAAGLTDPSSTYTVDSINADVLAHVIAVSTETLKKNRQGYCSKRDTYLNVKTAAGNLANYRITLCFQDVKSVNATGNLVQFQPWMLSTLAAAMQMAGFYKSVTNKSVNCSGVLQAAGDWSDQNYSNVSDAIQNGLFVAQKSLTGGIRWVADQTTYGYDQNFVYNRSQAVYMADVAALTIAQQMQDAFLGQTVADASAPVALAYLAGIMNNLKRLKVIVATDSAPAGYANSSVNINGPVMAVALQLALDGAIYFIPININIVQPQQSAG